MELLYSSESFTLWGENELKYHKCNNSRDQAVFPFESKIELYIKKIAIICWKTFFWIWKNIITLHEEENEQKHFGWEKQIWKTSTAKSINTESFDFIPFSSPLNKEEKLRIYTCKICHKDYFNAIEAIECCVCPDFEPGDFIKYNIDACEIIKFQCLNWVGKFGDGIKEFYFIITDVEKSPEYTRYSIKTLGMTNFFSQGWILKGDNRITRVNNVSDRLKREGAQFIGFKYVLPLSCQ